MNRIVRRFTAHHHLSPRFEQGFSALLRRGGQVS